MRVSRLRIRNLRRLEEVELEPGPGLNLLLGDNGAGKTSVLEALHLMAYGRSFRGRVRDGLIRTGADALEVYVEWSRETDPRLRRAGLRHRGGSWEGRLDGQAVGQLGELCGAIQMVTFEPGSHALVGGSGDPRRRFMDWGLFHVDPAFLPLWRRYARALKQRNALLKQGAPSAQLDGWDWELAATGEEITNLREAYLDSLQGEVAQVSGRVAPTLGHAALQFVPGWKRDAMPLADALLLARDRDRMLGHTTTGPHRADWRVEFSAVGPSEALSRGQGKLAALSCLLAQAQHLAGVLEGWPVVALDDLGSELDAGHRGRVLAALADSGAQIFVTGTDAPDVTPGDQGRVFHVEHGVVRPA